MFPLFRFTLSNPDQGTLVISEPGGWDEAKLKLERNKDFHSIVELYDQPLTFYGDDISHDGGIQYIRDVEQSQGIDAQISLLIEISHDEGDTYETLFTGILAIDTVKEIDFYKLEMGVLRDDFWQKFINRKQTPIDLAASVDLDGEARTVINPITLMLPNQLIRSRSVFSGDASLGGGFETGVLFVSKGVQIGLPIEADEIDQTFTIEFAERQPSGSDVINVIEAKYDGDIIIDVTGTCRIVATSVGGLIVDSVCAIYMRRNFVETENISVFKSHLATSIDETYDLTGQRTLSVVAGDLVYIWITWEVALDMIGDITYEFFTSNPFEIACSQNSTFPDSETDAFLIKDAAESILSKCIGHDSIVESTYLDSCNGLYAIMKGLHVRGYTLAERQFSLSFDDWWKGVDPILNLGLGYEPDKIRIEKKEYFYDKTISINFDFVNNIERSYDLDSVFKLIEIGYSKWSAESASGIDDPQSKHNYNTRFKTVGQEIQILSRFIAASLAIEQTRRNRVEPGKDWTLDDNVIIIAIKDTSPYEPELDENFSDVTNLLNAETRYNIRLSVARNFERWKSYFNGCLQWYINSPTDVYKFASGEGNYDMITTLFSDACDALGISPEEALSEKQDIEVTDDYLFKPITYSFEHPLTWDDYKTIRDNPTLAIGISRTDADHVTCFIKTLEYQITRGKGTFELYLADNDYL